MLLGISIETAMIDAQSSRKLLRKGILENVRPYYIMPPPPHDGENLRNVRGGSISLIM